MMYLVESIMSQPALTVDSRARVSNALETMKQKNVSSLVVNPAAANDAYGIVTKRDIVTKIVARNLDPRDLFVSDIMTKPVIPISPKASLRECSALMSKAGVRRLPVFDGDQLVGIISDTDIFQCVEERGWGPEIETRAESDRFLAGLREKIRAHLAAGADAAHIADAIMLAVSEVYRAVRK